MEIKVCTADWQKSQYELLDSGDGYKLESFGCQIISRPEPQAIWRPSLPPQEWERLSKATFVKTGGEERGDWRLANGAAQQWWVERGAVKMRLGLTAFKHVGIFPEQAANWDFMDANLRKIEAAEVLNMFAYTGGASIAAAAAGANVTHLDSIKVVNGWARENGEQSGFSNIRYITDDAMKFAAREVRRQRKYDAIILDPPAYGRGPEGEKWVLEQNILALLENCAQLLSGKSGSFLILNLYSVGFSAILADTLLRTIFGNNCTIDCGELLAADSFGKQLPLGIYARLQIR